MRKVAFLQKEPLSRLAVSFLLAAGVVLPLLLALDLGDYAPGALLTALGLLAVLTVLNVSRKSRLLLVAALGVTGVTQLFLPGFGLLGGWFEALKALALYFSSYTVVLPLFGGQVAGLLAVMAATLGYLFAKRGAGFLPAALLVVMVLFGLWSLGKGGLLWYTAPALVALLLQMSQAAHEKINILHVLPVAAVTVLLTFLLLPAGRLAVEPLAKAAGDLKQMISDYLFFTEPRNVFTLGTYGYYPMGNNQLGGEAEPSEYPVMMVKTDERLLMRAVVKDQYTGRSFTDTSSAKRYLYINPRWQTQRRLVFMENLPSEAIRKASHMLDQKAISVQMQNSAASTVFTPLYLRSLRMENDMVPYFNDSSELFITRDLAQGDRYTVYTPVIEGGQNGLAALVDASLKSDAQYQDILAAYTQLPSHLEQKVFSDAADIVRGETTPYGKAMAIMRHLQKYYRYTLTPDTPPANQDFVTYFLYVGREGYCTYYASAMTVLCRMAGLPARYVEGFLALPAGDGFAYVTGKDAHAWTEVYFEGFGWVPFDPTPSEQGNSTTPPENETEPDPTPSPSPDDQPTPTPDPNQPEDEPSPEPSDQPSDQPSEQPEDNPEQNDPDTPPDEFPWALLILAAALAALGARIALRMPARVARRMPTEKDRLFIYGAAVHRLLVYAKRTPRSGETPLAFARRVDGVRVFPTPIAPLWRMLALSNYSRAEITPAQTARARETFALVFKGSHPLRRIRFLLAAAFDPRFYRVLDTPAPHDEPPSGTALRWTGPAGRGKRGARVKTGPKTVSRPFARPGNPSASGGKGSPGQRQPPNGGKTAAGKGPEPQPGAGNAAADGMRGSAANAAANGARNGVANGVRNGSADGVRNSASTNGQAPHPVARNGVANGRLPSRDKAERGSNRNAGPDSQRDRHAAGGRKPKR